MAKRDLKEVALKLRKEGKSYSQIKEVIDVSKSSLSLWLKEMPLSSEQLQSLQGKSEKRIESFRKTMLLKKQIKSEKSFNEASRQLKSISDRDILIGGIFLYFGEGSKTTRNTTAVTNTNPFILKFFILWLEKLGITRDRLKLKVHLYQDMNVEKEVTFWTKTLSITKKQIRGPYIKASNQSELTYKSSYGHGTCTVLVEDADLFRKVSSYLAYMQSYFCDM